MDELKKLFKPEFLNRVDDIIVFNKLDENSIEKISRILLNQFVTRLKEQNIAVEFTDNVAKYISKVGFDKAYGARPLKRAIQNNIEDKFAEEMLDNKIKSGDNVIIDYIDDNVVISKK